MSRHIVTIRRGAETDPHAIIGYDPPMQTFFAHAFPHPITDEPALWLGCRPGEFLSLSSLLQAVADAGCEIEHLSAGAISAMIVATISLAQVPPPERRRAG